MPLEINEIGITMRVSGDHEGTLGHHDRGEAREEEREEEREELIEECVRRVLQALKADRER